MLELPSRPVLELVELTDWVGAELSNVLATELREMSFGFPYPRLRASPEFVDVRGGASDMGICAVPLFQLLPGPWRMKSSKSFVSFDETVGSRACSLDLDLDGALSSFLAGTVIGSGLGIFGGIPCPCLEVGRDLSVKFVRDPFMDLKKPSLDSFGFNSGSGPVDRMKSAKSLVVSFSILASLAAE